MPCSAVVLVLLRDRNDGGEHGMRKTRVFGQLLGVQGMVIGDVTVQADPDGDGEILVVSVRPDARSAGRCAQCRRSCPGYDPCHLSQYLAHFGLTIWRSLIELSGVVDRLPSCCRSSRACKAAERTLPEPRLRQRARPDCAT